MHDKLPIKELLERATKARNTLGPISTAEKLLLFNQVLDALKVCVERQQAMRVDAKNVRDLTRLLGDKLRVIERAPQNKGPSIEDVKAFYQVASSLSAALKQLQRSTDFFNG